MGTRSNEKIFCVSVSGGRFQKMHLEDIQTALERLLCVWCGFIRRCANEALNALYAAIWLSLREEIRFYKHWFCVRSSGGDSAV